MISLPYLLRQLKQVSESGNNTQESKNNSTPWCSMQIPVSEPVPDRKTHTRGRNHVDTNSTGNTQKPDEIIFPPFPLWRILIGFMNHLSKKFIKIT